MKYPEHGTSNNFEAQSTLAIEYDEYYSSKQLPTPFDPSVYGDGFNERLRNDLVGSTMSRLDEQIDESYPYKDVVKSSVLSEVDYQLKHRAEHNVARLQMLEWYMESGEVSRSDARLNEIIEKMRYGVHDAAEAGYMLSCMPEEFDGVEVKKYTNFGMSREEFRHEAYKTIGAFHRAKQEDPELGVSHVECVKGSSADYKQLKVDGVAPMRIVKQTLAEFEQRGSTFELVTRGSFVPLPHPHKLERPEHKIISLQQYVRRRNTMPIKEKAQQYLRTVALTDVSIDY